MRKTIEFCDKVKAAVFHADAPAAVVFHYHDQRSPRQSRKARKIGTYDLLDLKFDSSEHLGVVESPNWSSQRFNVNDINYVK